MDFDCFASYRPLINLTFFSKLLEKLLFIQVCSFLSTNNFLDLNQSAYRAFYSTETDLVKVSSDLLSFLNFEKVCIFLILDLSSTFNTIDHNILFEILFKTIGITGDAKAWLVTYLRNWTQCVRINEVTSPHRTLLFGVPRGSILGALLSTVYLLPLSEVLNTFNVSDDYSAIDWQIYLVIDSSTDLWVNKS